MYGWCLLLHAMYMGIFVLCEPVTVLPLSLFDSAIHSVPYYFFGSNMIAAACSPARFNRSAAFCWVRACTKANKPQLIHVLLLLLPLVSLYVLIAVVQVVLYFLFGNNMIAAAFLLSCFFSSAATAAAAAYLLVFGSGLVGSLLISQLATSGAWYTLLLQLVPSFALYRGLWEMGEYAFLAVYRNSYGLSLTSLSDAGNGMTVVWVILAVEWAVFMAAAWYAEQVLATGTSGSKRHACFCFKDSLKCLRPQRRRQQRLHELQEQEDASGEAEVLPLAALGNGTAAQQDKQQQSQQQLDTHQEQPDSVCIPIPPAASTDAKSIPVKAAAAAEGPPDVAAERARVQQLPSYEGHPIVVKQLQKTYPAQDGQPPKV